MDVPALRMNRQRCGRFRLPPDIVADAIARRVEVTFANRKRAPDFAVSRGGAEKTRRSAADLIVITTGALAFPALSYARIRRRVSFRTEKFRWYSKPLSAVGVPPFSVYRMVSSPEPEPSDAEAVTVTALE